MIEIIKTSFSVFIITSIDLFITIAIDMPTNGGEVTSYISTHYKTLIKDRKELNYENDNSGFDYIIINIIKKSPL